MNRQGFENVLLSITLKAEKETKLSEEYLKHYRLSVKDQILKLLSSKSLIGEKKNKDKGIRNHNKTNRIKNFRRNK